jgi:hypothetical protein
MNMNARNRMVWFTWTVVLLTLFAGLFQAALAQATNGTLTNLPPMPPSNPFPVGKDAAWFAVIPLATFAITWLVGKIQSLPKQLLPLITPILGWVIGYVIERATAANFPWWSTAGAGAVSTMLYESIKNITGAGPESKLTPTPKPEVRT